MLWPTFQWSTTNGPLPTGWPQSLLDIQSGSGTKPSWEADWSGRVTHGLDESSTSVRSSSSCAPERSLIAHADENTGEFMYETCERDTSAAVSGPPLWKR